MLAIGGREAAIEDDLLAALRAGAVAPYLGPGVAALAQAPVPNTHDELAAFLESQVPLPRHARGNPWAAAQYIESRRHRRTLVALMNKAFAPPVQPTALHQALARLGVPMIVDTWYDGAMRAALRDGCGDWGEIQGVPRTGPGEALWYRAYDADGGEVPAARAQDWQTLLYKPHGAVTPAGNYLIADSDYVEVLTEIDIQTPIPDAVRLRRADVGFLFLGCRFHDQMLRSYARQVMKRSAGPHYAVIDSTAITRNERRFLDDLEIIRMARPLSEIAGLINGAD